MQINLFLLVLIALFLSAVLSSQLTLGQGNSANRMKVPSPPDMESKSILQEMSLIKNLTSNYSNATGQEQNKLNNSNQGSQEFTNGTMNGSALFRNKSANF
jgi:hypothetical protein